MKTSSSIATTASTCAGRRRARSARTAARCRGSAGSSRARRPARPELHQARRFAATGRAGRACAAKRPAAAVHVDPTCSPNGTRGEHGRWTRHDCAEAASFSSHDHYVTDRNPDDSGDADYAATLPVVGILYALQPQAHLYVTAGQGLGDTERSIRAAPRDPTSRKPTPTRCRHGGLPGERTTFSERSAHANDYGLFVTHTRDEIVTLSNTGGRSTYQNVGARFARIAASSRWTKQLPHDASLHAKLRLVVDLQRRLPHLHRVAVHRAQRAGGRGQPHPRDRAQRRCRRTACLAASACSEWKLEDRKCRRWPITPLSASAGTAMSVSVGINCVLPSRLSLAVHAASGRSNLFVAPASAPVTVGRANSRFFEPAQGARSSPVCPRPTGSDASAPREPDAPHRERHPAERERGQGLGEQQPPLRVRPAGRDRTGSRCRRRLAHDGIPGSCCRFEIDLLTGPGRETKRRAARTRSAGRPEEKAARPVAIALETNSGRKESGAPIESCRSASRYFPGGDGDERDAGLNERRPCSAAAGLARYDQPDAHEAEQEAEPLAHADRPAIRTSVQRRSSSSSACRPFPGWCCSAGSSGAIFVASSRLHVRGCVRHPCRLRAPSRRAGQRVVDLLPRAAGGHAGGHSLDRLSWCDLHAFDRRVRVVLVVYALDGPCALGQHLDGHQRTCSSPS